jgi:Beta propeller domain
MPKALLLAAAVAALAAIGSAAPAAAHPPTAPRKTLTAFADERELAAVLKRWADEMRLRDLSAGRMLFSQAATATAPAPAAAAAEAESVTNVQHAGVDEGGIVKLHGEHLVILRRGRLFTVRIAGGALEPVSSAGAFGPDVDPAGAWYDEMLITGNTIAVIGYSYARGGTEVGLFEISGAGRLAHKGTYHLRSNDYYSSRNYASRLIGTKLVFPRPVEISR